MTTLHTPAASAAIPPITLPPLCPDALYRWAQVRHYIPMSRSAWLAGVRDGKYPQPVKLGPATTCWRGSDLLAVIAGGAGHAK